jgi:3,4-dihydroxy 2-butanone 4-phosphate synthase/GTP cyclohydrolase II
MSDFMPEATDEPRFNTIDEAVDALRRGLMVIVVDAAERENEGDFICAAESITAGQVDFMLRHGSGVLCVPMSEDCAEQLQLAPLSDNHGPGPQTHTNFLTPVDHADAGTGVSAANRAMTIRAIADTNSRPKDFVRPGHTSTLLAKAGGVLRRAGHTEATVDLVQMAGGRPVGCLIEILSQHGDGMADAAELRQIAEEFSLPIISIEDLIRYRRMREQLVEREVEVPIVTRFGPTRVIAYSVEHEDQQPMAIVWGQLSSAEAPLIRMHSSCFTGDVLESLRCDCGDQLHLAMDAIGQEGVGAVIYLPQEGRGIGLVAKLKAYQLQDQGYDTVEANHKLGFKADMRDYMIGLQILKDLGLSRIRLLTNNPNKADAFPAWDLEVVEQVPIVAPPEAHRAGYLATKKEKLGHNIPESAITGENTAQDGSSPEPTRHSLQPDR